MQIAFGGVPGAGKTTVAKKVADHFSYKFYSMGLMRREIAASRGLTIDQFNSLPEDTDSMVDDYQKKLGREGDNFVNDGRLAFYFMPNALKFYFYCDMNVAASRIFNDQRSSERKYITTAEVSLDLQARMKSDSERYVRIHGVDCYDPSKFDFMIDTTNKGIEEVVAEVLGIINSRK